MPMWPGGPNYPWEPQGQSSGDTGGYDPSQPIGGSVATAPAAGAPAATAPSDAVNKTLQALAAQNGGMPIAPPTPAVYKDPYTGEPTGVSSGNMVYTFPNNVTAEISSNGGLGAITPPKTQTAADTAAQSGALMGPGGQIYIKNPTPNDGRGPYIPSQDTAATQQADNMAKMAQANASQAQANVNAIDAMLKADPTNITLNQQKDAAQAQLQQAQATATTLNAQSTAARVGSQNQLDVAQAGAATQNAGSTALNAQSTAARVGSQNALDLAQAGTQAINAQVAQAKLQPDIGLTQAQTANYQAAAQAALQKAGEPTVQTTGTGPTYTYYDPKTGQMVTAQNTAYQPTDPGRMTAQLKQQADTQWQSLQQQVQQGKISGDQAINQFNKYWDENVEPLKGSIAQAQATQQSALAQQQAMTGYYNAQAANLPATLAVNASDAAQRNAISMMPYMVNSNAANNPGVTTGARGFPVMNPGQIMQNATFSLPNLQEIGRQGAAAALANISPTAAMHAQMPGPLGQPPAGGLPDMSSLLNRGAYQFPGMPPQGAAPMAPAAPAMPPPAMPAAPPAAPANPQWYQDWQASQGQSAMEQGIQAQIPWGQYQPAA